VKRGFLWPRITRLLTKEHPTTQEPPPQPKNGPHTDINPVSPCGGGTLAVTKLGATGAEKTTPATRLSLIPASTDRPPRSEKTRIAAGVICRGGGVLVLGPAVC